MRRGEGDNMISVRNVTDCVQLKITASEGRVGEAKCSSSLQKKKKKSR